MEVSESKQNKNSESNSEFNQINKTFVLKAGQIKKKWLLIDANDVVCGRLASEVAKILCGKHKAEYSPSMDAGDNVIIINASKIKLTSRFKLKERLYYRHTGYPGGLKSTTAQFMLDSKHPERVLLLAIKRMISKGPMGYKRLNNLYLYPFETHKHIAQKPEVFDIASLVNKKNI